MYNITSVWQLNSKSLNGLVVVSTNYYGIQCTGVCSNEEASNSPFDSSKNAYARES